MKYVLPSLVILTLASLSVFGVADDRKLHQGNRNRIVRVVTITQAELQRESDNLLEETMARLEQAASFQPDIACLPELFLNRPPEPVPGPVTDRLAAWARQHASYVVFGVKTKTGNRVYNAAVLIDRVGQICGKYSKIHPTEGELAEGTVPGGLDPPVFETDFGTIGIQICFDINWWDVWKRLKQQGAKIVFFPSAYPAARQLSALALMNQYYVVSSAMRGSSKIYDISGEVLASSGNYQQWAGAALPIGKRLFEIDFHAQKARQIQQKYGSKVDVVWFHDDDWFTLASVDPDLTVEDIISEFDLTPLNDYRVRATKAIDKARADAAAQVNLGK
jgi:beta-ureidopropionase